MNMKKLLFVLLAALLLVTLTACAGETEDDGNAFDDYRDDDVEITEWTDNAKNTFYFEAVDSESITITGFSSTNYQPHAVKLPAFIDGRKVVSISDEAFANCASIAALSFPTAADFRGSVPAFTLGDSAFRGCVALKSISIPAYVVSVGESVFYGCESMATVTLEAGCVLPEIPKNAFGACSALTSISIPACVESIGESAFFECTSLAEASIADGVKKIGKQAFQSCTALKRVDAPASLTEVGDYAFAACDAIEVASVPTWIVETLTKTNLVSVTLVAGESLPASAFKSCDKLETVVIECALTEIGESAFVGCKSLRQIEIPETVTVIGRSMFKNCSALPAIKIPAGVTEIGAFAFSGCTSLAQVTVPAAVVALGDQAFASCTSLTTLTVESGNTVYKAVDNVLYNADMTVLLQYAVGNEGTAMTIPSTVTEIKASAFAGASKLTTLVIPNSVKTIGKYAFDGCVSVADATLPASAIPSLTKDGLVKVTVTDGTEIADGAFEDCINLKTVITVDTVKKIGASAFAGCVALTDITLHNGMTEIAASTFAGCTALPAISIPESVTSIGANAFRGCAALEAIAVSKSVSAIGAGAFAECASLTAITVDAANTKYAADNGSLYNKGLTELLQYAIGKEDVSISLPKTVTAIASEAYLGAIHLKDLTIPVTVTTVGKDAFRGCVGVTHAAVPTWALGTFATDALLSLTVTGGEEIGAEVLANCPLLDTVVIPATVKSVHADAFRGCAKISHADVPAHAIAAIPKTALATVIVNSGDAIAADAFASAPVLTSVSLADSITKIGANAFNACVMLSDITFHEGITEIGENAFNGCSALNAIALPASLKTLGATAFAKTAALASITVAEGNTAFKAVENVLYSADGATLIQYATALKQYSFVIPATVKTVEASAFNGAANLICIEVGAGVEEIKSAAFSGCTKLIEIKNLSKLDIKPGRTHGNIASNTDKNLINIYGAEGKSKLSVAQDMILFTSGDVVMVMGYVGDGATITLPATATQVAAGAFAGIDFDEIVFGGTKEAWNAFKLGDGWDGGLESYVIKCTDGEIVVAPEETPVAPEGDAPAAETPAA